MYERQDMSLAEYYADLQAPKPTVVTNTVEKVRVEKLNTPSNVDLSPLIHRIKLLEQELSMLRAEIRQPRVVSLQVERDAHGLISDISGKAS